MMPDLEQYMWIAWLVLALVFVTIELLTLEFTFLMLAAGSLIGGLGVNILGGPWWLQVGAAAALSALLLFTIRPLLLRLLHKGTALSKTNVDALYGLGGRVVAPFDAGTQAGSVRLDNGETWTARWWPEGDSPVPIVGERVVVDSVHGATVDVVRAPLREEDPHHD